MYIYIFFFYFPQVQVATQTQPPVVAPFSNAAPSAARGCTQFHATISPLTNDVGLGVCTLSTQQQQMAQLPQRQHNNCPHHLWWHRRKSLVASPRKRSTSSPVRNVIVMQRCVKHQQAVKVSVHERVLKFFALNIHKFSLFDVIAILSRQYMYTDYDL